MNTLLVPGAPLRDALLAQVAERLACWQGAMPKLVIVQVGNEPASTAYVRHKEAAGERLGLPIEIVRLNVKEGEAVFHDQLRRLVADPSVTAIVPQTPLPAGWDMWAAINLIPPYKDCDGLTAANRALRLAKDARAIDPATPLGVLRLLAYLEMPLQDLPVAVIGRGMVGQPLREMLTQAGARVISIDKETLDPDALCRTAEVVCAAAGVPGLVTEDWVKAGAVLIDIGITQVNGRLKGDVAAAAVEGLARLRTPVPGGVGPLTVACLMTNVVDCARVQEGLDKVTWRVMV